MSTAWYYVLFFGVISWALLAISSRIRLPFADAVLGIMAILAGIRAGMAAQATWIHGLSSWAMHLPAPVRLIVSVLTFVLCLATVLLVLMHSGIVTGDNVPAPQMLSWMFLPVPIVAAWITLPSLLALGAIPGTGGRNITQAVFQLGGGLVRMTPWFG